MSAGRRPGMGPALGPPYQPHSGPPHPYMGQHSMPPMGPGQQQQQQQQQRFMMGGGQMGGQMYGPGPAQQPGGPPMYGMPPVSSQQGGGPHPNTHPGPPVSPAARPPTPQHLQQQQQQQHLQHPMQAMMQHSPKQPSPAPSASSEHGSTHSNKPGEDCPDVKTEPGNLEEQGGENSRGNARPVPSPVGSTGSRSNTPASIPGGPAGSPMPVRPNSGQLDGQNRMTQSPMTTQGYNQQMMPPPNSMGYMPSPAGKMGGASMPGHYPQYNSQYPQSNYGRQQPGMPGMGGPPMSGPMQTYPGSQPGMYPSGPGQMSGPMQGQMGGPPMYGGTMSGMNRGGQSSYYAPQPQPGMMGGSGSGQYPPYSAPHMGPMPPNMPHGMQQQAPSNALQGMMPQQMGNMPPSSAPTSVPSSNKAAQAAQAAMMAAANSLGPRSMPTSRGALSPSRGMFSQSGSGGPLAQMNSMTNSPNLGSPSLNSMSNAVEQLARSIPPHSSSPSPVPKSAAMTGSGNSMLSSSIAHTSDHSNHMPSPMSNNGSMDFHDNSSSRPNSTSTGPPGQGPDLPTNESTTGSDSSGGAPSDSTSVDSGFHSSDQGDKTSDSVNSSGQPGLSPPPPQQPNGDHHHHHHQQHPHMHHHHQHQQHPQHMQNQQQHLYPPRTSDNMSPLGQHPASHLHHQPYLQHPHHPMGGPEPKMPYSNAGVPLPPSSMSSAMSSMPSSSGAVTTTSSGPMSTSVTQSIAAPVTSVSNVAPPHPCHPQTHHMGPQGLHNMMGSHSMGPPPHGMMPNGGMPPSSMMPPGHMGSGPGQMGGHMGHNMMPPHSMNGPMMGPTGQMMGHNGPMMSSHSSNMPPMGQMSLQEQQQQQQPPPPMQGNCMPPTSTSNNIGSSNISSDDPPEKKKKNKDLEGQSGAPRLVAQMAHLGPQPYAEEPSSPGGLKSSDLSKLFEMGPEPDRRPFIERVLAFLEESGQPVTTMPVISKTPIDLYKLYFCVREKGGFQEVTANKKWRDICQVVNIGTSASAAFTLKKNYIRYLFNYECKFDRGGINPAPILAKMEAQLAQKREQKSKRAPSPAGSTNSNDAFRPPSVPNNQGDPGFPPSMPPPYMQQGPDGGNMPMNPHMSGGSMMMNPGNMMGGPPPPHSGMGNMMGGPPGPNMMPGPQGMMGGGPMPPNSGPGGMMGGPPPMMGQGYNGSPMMPQQQQQQQTPITSNSVSVQDPFSDESSYTARMAGPPTSGSGQPTPPPPQSSGVGAPVPSSYPSVQMSSSMMSGANTMTSTSNTSAAMNRAPTSSHSDHPHPHSQQIGFQATSSGHAGSVDGPSPGPQFPFGQQFDRPDRFDQSSPGLGPRPAAPGLPHSQGPPDSSGAGAPMYAGAPRFPGPQYPSQGVPYQVPPSSQYSGYPQQGPPGGPYSGPRPSGPMYGTPNKRFPEDHTDRGQWPAMQRARQGNGQGYLPPVSPSTPPMGPYSRQLATPRTSPHSRERYLTQKMPPAYGGPLAASLGKKDLSFPPDCVESVGISTSKRKRLTHKDLAPFEAWRLMLSLKSGLLAESTWALDTMNILLHDDATYGYFSLSTLPGLLEVLTEHFRHCLIAMFNGFEDLEAGQKARKPQLKNKENDNAAEGTESSDLAPLGSPRPEDQLSVQLLSGANYTMVTRKGLPVKLDSTPFDSSVLEKKEWDVYSKFHTPSDHWSQGCGDITDHILTHFESSTTNGFLSVKFKRKHCGDGEDTPTQQTSSQSKRSKCIKSCISVEGQKPHNTNTHVPSNETPGITGVKEELNECNQDVSSSSSVPVSNKTPNKSSHTVTSIVDSKINLSNSMCNGNEKKGDNTKEEKRNNSQPPESIQIKQEVLDDGKTDQQQNEAVEQEVHSCNGKENGKVISKSKVKDIEESSDKPLENGDIEQPKLSPMVNHLEKGNNSPQSKLPTCKDSDEGSDISPPVLKAEGFDEDEEDMEVDASAVPLNSTMKAGSSGANIEADTSIVAADVSHVETKEEDQTKKEEGENKNKERPEQEEEDHNQSSLSSLLNESCAHTGNETEELSASFVAELLREEGTVEEEAFQRDDPPLCVTPESRDELGRRCVCISNIVRSLSCVPGNEAVISKHAGIMRILGKLLLLQHSHPVKPPPRRLPQGEEEEEEREEEAPPRVYDDDHWWWDYLDQLRENTLVILANVCGHLQLANFSEVVCFPLLEGLLHWLTCPASVARDPLPTLGATSVLSPERLVLEALCKLCIHETNVDLLLATAHIRNLLSLYNVLVRLLADRQHQIPREFAIVLLSLLVPADCTVARAVALQPPCVALLVDFLETAEQAALTIASQQGVDALQANPEAMGTSLDMLRRAASILLCMSRVPDNRKMFLPQQSRLLNLVMSQILDQSVSNTLAEVLFECSQLS
ncbi:AT-rich interactive domain-containing protein 1b [Plakobranchus ocellatus]|uniref:AT-rich interactive domain-containing protein 1b n=1 Tax=Plakobranchus ocellatus TaxID=259542 RepID=A0AAV4A0J0_9GAST|nr:AT-rich interactive domain-containing protein 1b [Plakobranchus ocellatus]